MVGSLEASTCGPKLKKPREVEVQHQHLARLPMFHPRMKTITAFRVVKSDPLVDGLRHNLVLENDTLK